MKRITIEEFGTTSLSYLIEMAIEDVKTLHGKGVTIDMSDWIETTETGDVCTACLGGAALIGFADDNVMSRFKESKTPLSLEVITLIEIINHGKEENLKYFAYLLNKLRQKVPFTTDNYVKSICISDPKICQTIMLDWMYKYRASFMNIISEHKLPRLYDEFTELANMLKAQNC